MNQKLVSIFQYILEEKEKNSKKNYGKGVEPPPPHPLMKNFIKRMFFFVLKPSLRQCDIVLPCRFCSIHSFVYPSNLDTS
jgi:hypothetical protein